jgi:hypothetical protein
MTEFLGVMSESLSNASEGTNDLHKDLCTMIVGVLNERMYESTEYPIVMLFCKVIATNTIASDLFIEGLCRDLSGEKAINAIGVLAMSNVPWIRESLSRCLLNRKSSGACGRECFIKMLRTATDRFAFHYCMRAMMYAVADASQGWVIDVLDLVVLHGSTKNPLFLMEVGVLIPCVVGIARGSMSLERGISICNRLLSGEDLELDLEYLVEFVEGVGVEELEGVEKRVVKIFKVVAGMGKSRRVERIRRVLCGFWRRGSGVTIETMLL